jgi:hypothetical protein
MHPSGFDTRAVASDEAATFISISQGETINAIDDRIREILDANSFTQKISFIKDVLKVWIKYGRLGGRPSSKGSSASEPAEMFWQGNQERPQPGGHGTKFVWVTVGAPDGDGEYRSIVIKDNDEKRAEMDHEKEMELLKERFRAMPIGRDT